MVKKKSLRNNSNRSSNSNNSREQEAAEADNDQEERGVQDALRCAKAADGRGEYRKSAEYYLEAYRLIKASDPFLAKWFPLFDFFTLTLLKANCKAGDLDRETGGELIDFEDANVKGDLKVLEEFADSNIEPSLVCALAAHRAAKLHTMGPKGNLQLAAKFCRQAIARCESATSEEKRQVGIDTMGGEMKTVGDILSEMKENTMELLAGLARQALDFAVAANERGKYREAAEHFLEAYRLDVSDPSIGQGLWYMAISEFTYTISDANKKDRFISAEEDLKVLEEFADSKVEPSLVRAITSLSAATLHNDSKHNVQLVAKFAHQAIVICDSAPDIEKSMPVNNCGEMKQVGEILSEMKARSMQFLSGLVRKAVFLAVVAYDNGEYRKAADKYLEAYRLDVSYPSTSQGHWYMYFHNFSSMIFTANKKDGFIYVERDLKVLEKFADSKAEPSLVCAIASFAVACLHNDSKHNVELAAEFARQSIEICNSAPDSEMCRLVTIEGHDEAKRVGLILSETKDRSVKLLATMTEVSSLQVAAAGGESCDSCGKTREELGLTHMNCCKRCGLLYYCSAECQRNDWNAGHKKACRKKGQIEQGDVMKIAGLADQPDLNNCLVRIIGPAADNNNNIQNSCGTNQWKVELVGLNGQLLDDLGVPCMTVAADQLFHIRPVQENKYISQNPGPLLFMFDSTSKSEPRILKPYVARFDLCLLPSGADIDKILN